MGMTKKLLIVFASGLLVSLIMLSSAWVIGGDELSKRVHNGKRWSMKVDTDHNGPKTERTLTFDPALPLTISAPVTKLTAARTSTRTTVRRGLGPKTTRRSTLTRESESVRNSD